MCIYEGVGDGFEYECWCRLGAESEPDLGRGVSWDEEWWWEGCGEWVEVGMVGWMLGVRLIWGDIQGVSGGGSSHAGMEDLQNVAKGR